MIRDAHDVAGGVGWIGGWVGGQIVSYLAQRIGEAVLAGEVDYAGVAEAQGTYYNTVGA